HTNDAATTIPRLFDMGIEPFLVASSTNVIVGQRLVRKICEQCRVTEIHDRKSWEEYTQLFPKEMIKKIFGDKNEVHTYVGKGCDICNHTGYKGRVGIYEVMYVSEEIRRAIVSKENAATIAEIAKKEGMKTMLEDGLEKVKMGTTTLAEVIRGTKE
ncbi:MAG: type pilus assembly protein PilB, partial [Patescibacteria group bacterium]|nr:type pilus assembly protein PilB [Patescibacteria group bacterium]